MIPLVGGTTSMGSKHNSEVVGWDAGDGMACSI